MLEKNVLKIENDEQVQRPLVNEVLYKNAE